MLVFLLRWEGHNRFSRMQSLCKKWLQLKIKYLEYLQLFQQHLLHSVCVFVVDGDNF